MEISKLFPAIWVLGLFVIAAIVFNEPAVVVAWSNASESTGTFSTGEQPHGTLSQDVPTAPGFSETFSTASAGTGSASGGTAGTTGGSAGANATSPSASSVSYDQFIKAEQAAAKVEEIIKNDTKLQQAIRDALGLTELGADKIKDIAQATAEAAISTTSTRSISTDSSGRTTMSLSFTYSGEGDAQNFIVYDAVPKSFAASSDNITVTAGGATVDILEKDPKYSFAYQTLSRGASKTISYSVNKPLDSSVINSFSAPVFIAEKIIAPAQAPVQPPASPPGEKAPLTGKPIQSPKSSLPAILAIIIIVILLIAAWLLISKRRGSARKEYSLLDNV